jgi:hypothetical protein
MPALLNITDFKGEYALPQNGWSNPDINAQIEEAEKKYLLKLLGASLYDEFENRSLSPQVQKWTDFIDGVTYDTDVINTVTGNPWKMRFEGAKKMLMHLTYAEIRAWVADRMFTGGTYEAHGENSENQDRAQRNVMVRKAYNEGVKLFEDAHIFLNEYLRIKEKPVSITESTSGTYTIELSEAPIYLSVGDIMKKGALTVDAIVDEFVTATGAAGLTFTDVEWYPFGDVDTEMIYIANIF